MMWQENWGCLPAPYPGRSQGTGASAATRDRILAYIEEHGFYPNAAAQSLAQSRTNNIAIILPEVNTLVDMPFFHTCMYGVEEVAQANDYDIIVVTTNGNDT